MTILFPSEWKFLNTHEFKFFSQENIGIIAAVLYFKGLENLAFCVADSVPTLIWKSFYIQSTDANNCLTQYISSVVSTFLFTVYLEILRFAICVYQLLVWFNKWKTASYGVKKRRKLPYLSVNLP